MTKKYNVSMVLGLALFLATSAFAANRGTVQVSQAVTVAGTQLAPGEYKLVWEGSGPNVDLKFMQGGRVVATTPARVIDLKQAPYGDEAVVNKSADGSASLAEIRMSGKRYALQIGNESARLSGGNQ
jgi:hypothetical protein